MSSAGSSIVLPRRRRHVEHGMEVDLARANSHWLQTEGGRNRRKAKYAKARAPNALPSLGHRRPKLWLRKTFGPHSLRREKRVALLSKRIGLRPVGVGTAGSSPVLLEGGEPRASPAPSRGKLRRPVSGIEVRGEPVDGGAAGGSWLLGSAGDTTAPGNPQAGRVRG